MSTLSSPSARSPFLLLLLPFAVAMGQACHGSSSEATAAGSDFCDDCDTDDATGSFGGPGSGGAGGASPMPPPMDVCPTGSLSQLAPCTPTDPSCNVSSLCMAP